MGIDVVNYIAWKEGLIEEKLYLDIKGSIKRAFITSEIEIREPQRLFEIIKTDKKVRGEMINLALPDAPSHLIVYPMRIDERLRGLFEAYLEETHAYYCH